MGVPHSHICSVVRDLMLTALPIAAARERLLGLRSQRLIDKRAFVYFGLSQDLESCAQLKLPGRLILRLGDR